MKVNGDEGGGGQERVIKAGEADGRLERRADEQQRSVRVLISKWKIWQEFKHHRQDVTEKNKEMQYLDSRLSSRDTTNTADRTI